MKHLVFLAGQYLRCNRLQSAILMLGVAVTVYLPLTVNRLVSRYQADLARRAAATPLVAGGLGSRFDLVLHGLYFRGSVPRLLKMADVDAMRATGYAEPIPLYLRNNAKQAPVVGTTPDYFALRHLVVSRGDLPLRLGDCILGSEAAAAMNLGPGDRLLTDPENVFNIAGAYPLKMRVTGVLAPSGTPDDRVVFTDIKTAWVIAGLGHGHQDVTKPGTDENLLLGSSASNVTANAALPEFGEITPENIADYHFHGDPADFPVSAILPVCPDAKAEALLRGRYLEAEARLQLLVPRVVVDELFGMVFRIKRFFDANAALVAVSTGLFLGLVVILSLRLRRSEMETMHRIGCARGVMFRLVAVELVVIGLAGTMLAVLTSFVTLHLVNL